MADLIAGRLTLPELFHELSTRVREVADCSFVTFILHDPLKNVMRIELWEGAEVPDMPSELMMEHSASGWVVQSKASFDAEPRIGRSFPGHS